MDGTQTKGTCPGFGCSCGAASNPSGEALNALLAGIVQRALTFVIGTVLPGAISSIGGPFGALVSAALKTDYVQALESHLTAKIGELTSAELQVIEADCMKWASDFMATHPEAQAFWNAVRPPPPPQMSEFSLKDDELAALLAAQKDGTLRPRLGLK